MHEIKKIKNSPYLLLKFFYYFFFLKNFKKNKTFKITNKVWVDFCKKEWIIENFSMPILLFLSSKLGFKNFYFLHKSLKCSHLKELIKKEFGYKISNNWNHWNGGVFLFSEHSFNFMNDWHNFSEIILKKNFLWKTRDQTGLILAALKNKLLNHYTFSNRFNFIADFYNVNIDVSEEKGVFINYGKKIKPVFMHVFHHWGDENWSIWKKILNEN